MRRHDSTVGSAWILLATAIRHPVVEGILPKSAHAQNEYSCDTVDKLILASIDIMLKTYLFLQW